MRCIIENTEQPCLKGAIRHCDSTFVALRGRQHLWRAQSCRVLIVAPLLQRSCKRDAHAGASYWLGILIAAAWTTAGAALALMLPGGGADGVGPMVATGAWFTLWSFIGLLVLPSISRPAVRAADAAAARSWPATAVAGVISTLDARQDDEPERPGAIETIFHPIPGAASRISGLASARPAIRPWHVARLALPMSWCCLGFLGRAVHCNAGRPELWVLLPAD